MNAVPQKIQPKQQEINAQDDKELRDWSEKFDVTKVKLKAAINAAGPLVMNVEAWLKKGKDYNAR